MLKLAEIFGTTVDLLLDSDEDSKQSPAEQIYYLYKMEEEKKAEAKNKQRLNNVKAALLVAVVYIIVYLVGRFIWCDFSQSSFIGWLFTIRPSGEHSYLYGWLLSSSLFWYAMAISVIPALFGKSKFSLVTTAAFKISGLESCLNPKYNEAITNSAEVHYENNCSH